MSGTAPKLSSLLKLEIAGEAAFGTEQAGEYEYVEAISIDRSGLTREAVVYESQKQTHYDNPSIVGIAGGQITTEHYVAGYTDTLPVTGPVHVTPNSGASGFDMLIGALASALGNVHSGAGKYEGSAVVTWSAPNLGNTDAGGGLTGFVEGGAVAWERGTPTESYAMGWFTDIATGADPDTGALLQTPMGGSTPTGDKLFGAYDIFLKHGDPYRDGPCKSFSLRLTGDDTDDQTVALGCAPSGVTFDIAGDQPAKMTITWAVASWSEIGANTPPTTHAGLTVGDWSAFATPRIVNPAICMWGAGAATRIVMDTKVDFGIALAPLKDASFPNGIGGWYTTEIKPRISFSVYRDLGEEASDFIAQLENEPFTFVWGDQPGRMFGFCIPQPYIESYPTAQDTDGAVTSEVVLTCGFYDGDGVGADAFNPLDTTPTDVFFKMAFI